MKFPAYNLKEYTGMAAVLAMLLLSVSLMFLPNQPGVISRNIIWSMLLIGLAMFLFLFVHNLFVERFRQLVRSKQGRLCPKCHYPTPGDLAEGQRCSECGVVFSGWMIREWNEMWKPKSSEMKAEIPAEKTD